jgi:hypothetical protein
MSTMHISNVTVDKDFGLAPKLLHSGRHGSQTGRLFPTGDTPLARAVRLASSCIA